MAFVARAQEPSHRRRLSVDSLSLLELVVLVPAAGVFVLWLIPKWFDIHWSCVTGSGELGNTPGDSYSDTFAVLGTFGWIVVAIIALFARVAERPRLAAVIAAAWFGLLVGGALLSAAAIGPRTLSELIRRKRLRGRRDRAASAARLPAPEGDA